MNDAVEFTQDQAAQLVWGWRSQELRHWPIMEHGSWVAAVQKDMIDYDSNGRFLPTTQSSYRAYRKACVVMMLKDECDVVGVNLQWLYTIGFRHFVIADNNSTDDSLEIVHRFKRDAWSADVVIVEDPTVRYTQSEKTTGLMRLASQYWSDCQWVFPIDADEFLVAGNGLAVLDGLDARIDAVVISKTNHYLNAASERQSSSDCGWLGRMPMRAELGNAPPKIALKPRQGYVIGQGNHSVLSHDVTYAPGLQLGFHYREFQARSFEQFKRKAINGGKAVELASRYKRQAVGGNHWVEWYRLWLAGGDAALRELFDRTFVHQADIHDPFDALSQIKDARIAPPVRPPLPNVALGKPADQSSVGRWSLGASTTEDAAGAVNGNITGGGSFHTDKERFPWWQVDLEAIFRVSEVWIHNRLDEFGAICRFESFCIDASADGKDWRRLYATSGPQTVGGFDGFPFVFKTPPALVRFLRITLLGTDFLHLDEVEVFALPYPART